MFEDAEFDLKGETLMDVSKPLFYGFTLLSASSILVSMSMASSMFGTAVLLGLGFVSAGIAEGMNKKWAKLLKTVSLASILFAMLFASYFAMMLTTV